MSNEITKFYQFLSQYGQNWSETVDSEYGNDDGSVIKAEFREFLNSEWDGEQMGLTLDNDLINKFWKSIDTNQSTNVIKGTQNIRNYNGLDDKELEKMNQRIEAYEKFNEYTSSAIVSTGVLNSYDAEWRRDVINELAPYVDKWVDEEGCQGDLVSYLEQFRPAIENKYTAQYCALEYQNELISTVLADYADYKIADDATLQGILTKYLDNISASSSQVEPAQIKDEIRNIIDAYFATAGLGSDSGYDLTSLGYNPELNSPLNDIQKQVLKSKLEAALESIKSGDNYEKSAEVIDLAIDSFIDSKLSSATFGNFDEMISSISSAEFTSSQEYKDLLTRIEVFSLLDPSEGSELYNSILNKLGETYAGVLAQDSKFLPDLYNQLMNEVADKVVSGDLSKSDVISYFTEQLLSNFSELFPSAELSEVPLSGLESIYDSSVEAAAAEEDNDKSLQMYKDAALKYCEALVDKGGALKDAVIEIMGSDYKSTINNASYPSEFTIKIKELMEKAAEIGEIENMSVSAWSGISSDYTLGLGCTMNLNVSATIQNGDRTVDPSRITYSASVVSGSGSVSCTDLGALTIKAGSTEGYLKVEVYAMVDGIQVGEPKVINLKCELTVESLLDQVAAWGGISEHLETYGCGSNGSQLTGFSFADLYNNDAVIQLHRREKRAKKNGWDDNQGTVHSRLNELGNYIITALTGAGLESSTLNTAVTNVINTLVSKGPVGYSKRSGDIATNTSNAVRDCQDGSYRNTIVEGVDKDGIDEKSYQISFRDFVDMIFAEYKKLGGSVTIES